MTDRPSRIVFATNGTATVTSEYPYKNPRQWKKYCRDMFGTDDADIYKLEPEPIVLTLKRKPERSPQEIIVFYSITVISINGCFCNIFVPPQRDDWPKNFTQASVAAAAKREISFLDDVVAWDVHKIKRWSK